MWEMKILERLSTAQPKWYSRIRTFLIKSKVSSYLSDRLLFWSTLYFFYDSFKRCWIICELSGYQITVDWEDSVFRRRPKVPMEYLLMNFEQMKKNEQPTSEFKVRIQYISL